MSERWIYMYTILFRVWTSTPDLSPNYPKHALLSACDSLIDAEWYESFLRSDCDSDEVGVKLSMDDILALYYP